MKETWIILLILTFLFTFCDKPQKNIKNVESRTSIGYNLSAPDRVYSLPESLQEISGITEIDSSAIACIQDERETVFIFDLNSAKVIRRIDGGYPGDYEGIARVDSTLYILRSDGRLIEIKNFGSDKYMRTAYTTSIPLNDNEGLCFDPANNNLLITSKETPRKSSGDKDKRFIYGFNLASKKLIQEPLIAFDLSAIDSFALANNIPVPMKEKKKGKKKEPDIRFLTSDLAIHPISGKLFLLSSVDKLLLVFNTKYEIEHIEKLNPELFKQPEGITFMKNGDMYISNEGKNKSATLVRFKYRPETL